MVFPQDSASQRSKEIALKEPDALLSFECSEEQILVKTPSIPLNSNGRVVAFPATNKRSIPFRSRVAPRRISFSFTLAMYWRWKVPAPAPPGIPSEEGAPPTRVLIPFQLAPATAIECRMSRTDSEE